MNTTKTRFPLAQAEAVGQELLEVLRPSCERIEIAGSIRRRRPDVGDVELLCISRSGGDALTPNDWLKAEVDDLILRNVLKKRLNKAGNLSSYGPSNKYVVHVASGIPVDIFTTTEDNWGMALVVRTGPANWNTRMMTRFKNRGMQGHAYGGVTQGGVEVSCRTEEEVFRLLDWPYRNPEDRV